MIPKYIFRTYFPMLIRYFFWTCGALSLALGIIDIFLLILPTMPFVLLAAACWAKASPHFHRWLYQHPHSGPMVQDWERNHVVSRRTKYFTLNIVTVSCLFLFWRFPEKWWIGAVSAGFCFCVTAWMRRLPDS